MNIYERKSLEFIRKLVLNNAAGNRSKERFHICIKKWMNSLASKNTQTYAQIQTCAHINVSVYVRIRLLECGNGQNPHTIRVSSFERNY